VIEVIPNELTEVYERDHSAFDLDVDRWSKTDKPSGISGLFRLRDEEDFMVQSVESHIEHLDEAVLIVQRSVDNTEKLAYDLSAKYMKKVRVVTYPFAVYPYGSLGYTELPANSIHSLVYFTNWSITQCRFSWIAKIEGDCVALSTFATVRKQVMAFPNALAYYGRVGLNMAGRDVDHIVANYPRNGGWDVGVFNNDPMWHFIKMPKWEQINLDAHRPLAKCLGFSFLHLKRCRYKDRLPQGETAVPFNRENVRIHLEQYNRVNPYPAGDTQHGPNALFERTLVTPGMD
jgi:hypothetical protein